MRLYEAMLLGCVPVIMSDGLQLPFQDRVDYSKLTVRYVCDDTDVTAMLTHACTCAH